ncbi:zona pellucida sperm-binding protein 3-like [Pimephales promelas]|uniref:zona pellucida sperm-binding protein 3-like n=1 Tax=Pimephales promelas TaxID=90988 RepID=UPI0019558FB9|nr:zona pellucida sperm-binding protein 3-like [Pimephales promelas]KAG1938035.1 zona pellucida sperm-binding protein 3a.2 [Pimephales promelas]
MGRSSVVIDFIFTVSCGLMCCADSEQLNVWKQSLDQGSRQNAIFRYPMPAQTDQSVVGFGSNMFQNLIESRAPWRPDPALVRPSSQELPMQAQSQRTNYAPAPLHPSMPMPSQVNFGLIKPEQKVETFSQTQQGLQKPIPGPDLFPDVHDEVIMGPDFEPKVPEPANSVQVQCGEDSVQVQVKQDFLGNDQFIDPSDLTLGGCPFVGFDDHARIVAFESALQGCGSTLTMTEDSLVYSFVMVYSPSPLHNTPIVKTNEAMVALHCIYPRKHNVSSNSLHPTWIPYAAARAGDEYLHFSLKIMSDDWRYERPSNTFFLGDFINLEASVVRGNHVPLRVFVESCAATLGPSGEANSIYTFIENNGCMLDAKLTNSRSRFIPRTQEDKLQFQIEAFRFHQDSRGLIYITCHLKATTTSRPIDMTNKACSFVHETNGWTAASGDDQVCGCCETSCAMRKGRSLDTDDSTLEDEATIGPIVVQQLPMEKEPLLQIQESYQEPSKDAEYSIALVLLTVLLVAVGILCVVILGTLFCQRRQKLHALACE